jgi:hypothetical protein
MLGRFFGVVVRPRTWLNVLFQWVAFPLGLFYFVFLSVGLSMGLGMVIVWVGIPILLVVAGAWWLFGAFERIQAKYLLGADVPPAPRAWESANGVWGRLKAHFGSAATWKDLLYLFAKLAFGIVSTTLLATVAGLVFWCFALPVAAIWRIDIITTSAGGWHPPLPAGLLGIPAGVLVVFLGLHLLNGWGWVCRVWAELMFRDSPSAPAQAVTVAGAMAPLVSVSPASPAPLVSVPPRPPAPPQTPAPPAPPQAPAAPQRPNQTVSPEGPGTPADDGFREPESN